MKPSISPFGEEEFIQPKIKWTPSYLSRVDRISQLKNRDRGDLRAPS